MSPRTAPPPHFGLVIFTMILPGVARGFAVEGWDTAARLAWLGAILCAIAFVVLQFRWRRRPPGDY